MKASLNIQFNKRERERERGGYNNIKILDLVRHRDQISIL